MYIEHFCSEYSLGRRCFCAFAFCIFVFFFFFSFLVAQFKFNSVSFTLNQLFFSCYYLTSKLNCSKFELHSLYMQLFHRTLFNYVISCLKSKTCKFTRFKNYYPIWYKQKIFMLPITWAINLFIRCMWMCEEKKTFNWIRPSTSISIQPHTADYVYVCVYNAKDITP